MGNLAVKEIPIAKVGDRTETQFFVRSAQGRAVPVIQLTSDYSHLFYGRSTPASGAVTPIDQSKLYFIFPIAKFGDWHVNGLEIEEDCVFFCSRPDVAHATGIERGQLAGHVSRSAFVDAVASKLGVHEEDVAIPDGNYWLGKRRVLALTRKLAAVLDGARWSIKNLEQPVDALALDLEIASIVAMAVLDGIPEHRSCARQQANTLVDKATTLLVERSYNVSLTTLCSDLGVQPWVLIDAFNLIVGMPPGAYARSRRMAFVRKELLCCVGQRAPVKRAALGQGFRHLGRFSNDYLRLFGELPSETTSR